MRKMMFQELRESLERRVIHKLQWNLPLYDQYLTRYRFPALPKIVVYSNFASTEKLLKNVFPLYNFITPTLTAETDDIISRRIAEELLSANSGKNQTLIDDSKIGYVLNGFPFNTQQAQLFDKYLNGVNLALYIRKSGETSDYEKSIKPLLDYYENTGTLLELEAYEDPTFEEFDGIVKDINAKIKRTI